MIIAGIPFVAGLLIIYSNCASQTLEMHTIDIGQGDSSRLIIRDKSKLCQLFTTAGKAIPFNRAYMLNVALNNHYNLTGAVLKRDLIDFGDNSSDGVKRVN